MWHRTQADDYNSDAAGVSATFLMTAPIGE